MRFRPKRGIFGGHYRFNEDFYELVDIPTKFQEKIERKLGYRTPAWLDDMIVVSREKKQDHDKKLFDVLSK